jgi:hypothetical protein
MFVTLGHNVIPLKVQPQHQREIAPGLGHIDEPVIAGVIIVAPVEQVVCMEGDAERSGSQRKMLSG